jgi:hypothetical protein
LSGGSTQPTMGLGIFVSDKIKEAIWSNKFVDFVTLLPSYRQNNYLCVKNHEGSLCLTSSITSRSLPIEDWITAFMTYMSVYIQKCPSESQHLLKYLQIVRGIAHRGGDFHKYDDSFRRMRQSTPAPWDTLHTELFLQVMLPNGQQPRHMQPFRASHRSNRVPKGFCVKFHLGKFCGGCSYKHSCYICGASHSKQNCKQLKTFSPPPSSKPNTAPNSNKK